MPLLALANGTPLDRSDPVLYRPVLGVANSLFWDLSGADTLHRFPVTQCRVLRAVSAVVRKIVTQSELIHYYWLANFLSANPDNTPSFCASLGNKVISKMTVERRYPAHMHMTVEQITAEALSSPSESRALLADRLAESFDPAEPCLNRQLWVAEALRRRDAVRNGRVRTIPGDEALARVRRAVAR
jgi:hypothetical protein